MNDAGQLQSHEDRIVRLVEQMLKERYITREIQSGDILIETGLTSLDLVKLVFKVESEFDLTIPVSDITPANFQTILTIRALVNRLVGA